jgi:hypothetical protein
LGKFLGKEKEYDIEGLGTVKIYPLRVKDMSLFKENATKEEQMEISKKLFKLSLKDETDITDEEIENLPLGIFTKIMEAVNEVNGFGEQNSGIRKIKEQIALRKAGQ